MLLEFLCSCFRVRTAGRRAGGSIFLCQLHIFFMKRENLSGSIRLKAKYQVLKQDPGNSPFAGNVLSCLFQNQLNF